eukprot:2993753-Prymnesium_polylepis.1
MYETSENGLKGALGGHHQRLPEKGAELAINWPETAHGRDELKSAEDKERDNQTCRTLCSGCGRSEPPPPQETRLRCITLTY